MTKRLQEIKEMMQFLPGISATLRRSAKESFTETPFANEIALVDLPHKYMEPRFKTYDSTSDPGDHISHYHQAMLTTSLPRDIREASFCKFFGNSLSSPAIEWYVNPLVGTIRSFSQLRDSFIENFVCSLKPEKQTDDLYAIR